ncbi:type VI secretion IcmF C-terminal domain-containing protein [Nannocystis sp. SCPEA4]|uniref:type VI secretion IcmF C-terminal domain-containing protein n=1 Tax=Nannocystis sp. SCPEA4 TaxID=2996787 RepID=UPI00226F9340|nr:type VI secretion IcmF C-terminal domain-containing protein [Nannocystis sp. SCPEA4]MCY1060189.1 hypothetical protein [Nannocystis sp. SCPEA4]
MSLRYALVLVASLAVYGAAEVLGLPRWLAMIAAGLACAAALALPRLLARLRRSRESSANRQPDPRTFGAALADRVRRFAADPELGERGVHCILGCPGADVAAWLGAAEFTREELAQPGGPTWHLWRRRGVLCLEIPAAYLDESSDAAWQTTLDVLPRRLLRAWTRSAVLVVPWTALETGEPAVLDRWAELARGRLRGWARRIGLALPVHLALASAGDPALGPLLGPPLQIDLARPWGFRLPFASEPLACQRAAVAALEALVAAFATRVVEDLGAPRDDRTYMSEKSARPHDLLPLIPRLQRLVGPVARFTGALLAGAPSLQTIWPCGVYLTGSAPAAFVEGLFTEVLADSSGLVRPHGLALRRRRRLVSASGLALTACLAGFGLLALRVYRHNQALLTGVQEAAAKLPIAAGPAGLERLRALRQLDDDLVGFEPWPQLLVGLASATQLRPAMRAVYTNSVHHALYLPTLERARARLCPARAVPLSDADAPGFEALLQLYVLGTRTVVPGKENPLTAAEQELRADPTRRDAVVLAGVNAAWLDDLAVSAGARAAIGELLLGHVPLVIQSSRLHPRREDSCVRAAKQQLEAWRARACALEGLAELVPGRHSLRELLQSPHADALARPDEHTIAAVHTAAGFARLQQTFADPRPRCGLGGFPFGHTQDDDSRAAEANRAGLFARYAEAYVAEWERFLGDLAPADPRRGCDDLAPLLRRLAANDGPLRKLPDALARTALPPLPEAPDGLWHRAPADVIRRALGVHAEASRLQDVDQKPAVAGLLQGLDKLRGLLAAGASQDAQAADDKFAEARTLVENACSLLDPRAAGLLRGLVQPLFDRTFRCVERGGRAGVDPWCAEVVAPFARGLGGAYPFDPHARREVQVADLCAFYCPQGGAAWRYYEKHLAAVLLATGNGRFAPLDAPGFVSFRSYNPALAPFYGRTWQLSTLLFPFGDAPQPSLRFAVYIPPIDQPDVEVEEVRLELDGQVASFTNARERWRDLTWPGDQGSRAQAGAVLQIRGRYRDQPFSEQLEERGVWALFRLLERAAEATWSGDHLRFRFGFAALHGLTVDLELDAGLANELLLDRKGKPLAAFRAAHVAPPLQLRTHGDRCPH